MTESYDIIRGIAFPFQLGPNGFPEPANDDEAIRNDLITLVLIGKNEIVMDPNVGTDVHQYTFENMTAIDKARIASSIATQIIQNEPRVTLIAVNVQAGKTDLEANAFIIDIVYKRAGQVQGLQVPIP